MSRTEHPQEDAEQPTRSARREPKSLDAKLDAKNALLALNRREPEASRRTPQADALESVESLESLDTERILQMPRRKSERSDEPAPISQLPVPLPVARASRGMTMLGEA